MPKCMGPIASHSHMSPRQMALHQWKATICWIQSQTNCIKSNRIRQSASQPACALSTRWTMLLSAEQQCGTGTVSVTNDLVYMFAQYQPFTMSEFKRKRFVKWSDLGPIHTYLSSQIIITVTAQMVPFRMLWFQRTATRCQRTFWFNGDSTYWKTRDESPNTNSIRDRHVWNYKNVLESTAVRAVRVISKPRSSKCSFYASCVHVVGLRVGKKDNLHRIVFVRLERQIFPWWKIVIIDVDIKWFHSLLWVLDSMQSMSIANKA